MLPRHLAQVPMCKHPQVLDMAICKSLYIGTSHVCVCACIGYIPMCISVVLCMHAGVHVLCLSFVLMLIQKSMKVWAFWHHFYFLSSMFKNKNMRTKTKTYLVLLLLFSNFQSYFSYSRQMKKQTFTVRIFKNKRLMLFSPPPTLPQPLHHCHCQSCLQHHHHLHHYYHQHHYHHYKFTTTFNTLMPPLPHCIYHLAPSPPPTLSPSPQCDHSPPTPQPLLLPPYYYRGLPATIAIFMFLKIINYNKHVCVLKF